MYTVFEVQPVVNTQLLRGTAVGQSPATVPDVLQPALAEYLLAFESLVSNRVYRAVLGTYFGRAGSTSR